MFVATSIQAYPSLPQLALVTGFTESAGNGTIYPDGRIWLPRSESDAHPREVLIPVFIKSCWVTDGQGNAEPIRSFKFKVQYDGTALRAIGVQKLGPLPKDTFSLAKDFDLEWDDAQDVLYKHSLNSTLGDQKDGRRIRITGTSAHPMPPSPPENAFNCDQREFVELVYIRFRVLVTEQKPFPDNLPLIITNDTIRYNDRDVKQPQFTGEPIPGQYAGLAGLNNENLGDHNIIEPTRPGVAYVNFSNIGRFDLQPSSQILAVDPSVKSDWNLVLPLLSYRGSPERASRQVALLNEIPTSRITDITVTSDAPWLKFRTVTTKSPNPIPSLTRQGYINYIDNGILGKENPLGNLTTQDPVVFLEISADPSDIPADDPNNPDFYDGAGKYIGYITISSKTAKVSPIRIRVTFIVYRTPVEPFENPDDTKATPGRGINLLVENSATPSSSTTMIFGTGVSATDGIDPLFGEEEYETALAPTAFGARWYPQDAKGNNITNNGLKDLLGLSNSRDIRGVENNVTHTYYAHFEAGNEQNYPVVISWDVNDFPVGARLFIRGPKGEFITDMRNATPVKNQPGRFSVTITDARIKEFVIEYTPVNVVKYPIVQKGWNLISLPVRPGNPDYRDVFPNSLDAPQYFSANSYFQEPDGKLRFGVGYFVKYGNFLDKDLAGISVDKVGFDTPYRILLREGWNTIGALSFPVNVQDIKFDPYQSQTPQLVSGVYRYRTDRGYEEVSSLIPGVGYWIKIKGDGYLNMVALHKINESSFDTEHENVILSSSKVAISDNAQKEGTLYLTSVNADMNRFNLPPMPPAGLFDVRFMSGRYIENTENPVISLTGVEYPVALSIENANHSYNVVDAVTNEVIGSVEKGKDGFVQINNPKTFAVKLQTTGEKGEVDFAVEQNTPNPFSNQTSIRYSIPSSEFVTIKVYNTLGQEVATLVNGQKNAGTYTQSFSAQGLENGVYTYTFKAGNFSSSRKMVVVK